MKVLEIGKLIHMKEKQFLRKMLVWEVLVEVNHFI